MNWDNFEFRDPAWLGLLLLIPLLLILRGRQGRSTSLVFSSIAIAREVVGQTRSRAGAFLFLLRVLCLIALILGMARPRIGEGYESTEMSGIDIMLVVDVSPSMWAEDFDIGGRQVNRLVASKHVLRDFIQQREHDRIGIIAFAEEPYLISPPTLNHEWLLKNLENSVQVGIVGGGTAIGSAIGMAANRLLDLEDAKTRIMVLLTDGENNSGEVGPIAAAEAAANFDCKIYAIGAGSDRPVKFYGKDENGELITNQLGFPSIRGTAMPVDMEMLDKVASITLGESFRASDTEELEAVYDKIDALEKTEAIVHKHELYNELFAWCLMGGLILLAGEIGLAQTLYRRIP